MKLYIIDNVRCTCNINAMIMHNYDVVMKYQGFIDVTHIAFAVLVIS